MASLRDKTVGQIVVWTSIIFLWFLLMGCALKEPPSEAPATSITPDQKHKLAPGHDIYEFKLEDGTRCVILDGRRTDDLECQFNNGGR